MALPRGKSPRCLQGLCCVPGKGNWAVVFWSLSIKAVFYPSHLNVSSSTNPHLEKLMQLDGGLKEAVGKGQLWELLAPASPLKAATG